MQSAIRQRILETLEKLSPEQQESVLRYSETMLAVPQGVKGVELSPFFGAIPDDDADAMMVAIQEACEQVDENAW